MNTILKKRYIAIICSLLIALICIIALFFRKFIVMFAGSAAYPECQFLKTTGYLCPACGNTRAAVEILHGHFLRAICYNPTLPILLIVLVMFYIEIVAYAFGKKIYIVPRNDKLLYILVGVILAYYLMRNFVPWLTLCT